MLDGVIEVADRQSFSLPLQGFRRKRPNRIRKSARTLTKSSPQGLTGLVELPTDTDELLLAIASNSQLKPSEAECLDLLSLAKSKILTTRQKHLVNLIELRFAAFHSIGRHVVVFSMRKSGSSFVTECLKASLLCESVSLETTTPLEEGRQMGTIAQEHDMDELAVIHANLVHPSWISHAHSRATSLLGQRLHNFQITPVIVIRNIFDTFVSLDDQYMKALSSEAATNCAHFTYFIGGGRLSNYYCNMPKQERFEHLIDTWGKWCIEFFISWKRLSLTSSTTPIFLSYERDILDHAKLQSGLVGALDMNEGEASRLQNYLLNPCKIRTRFNVGVAGRGKQIAPSLKQKLIAMAYKYLFELHPDELSLLFGEER